ncbi:type IA DNA topoisomerase, partial [Enterococcus faecium]
IVIPPAIFFYYSTLFDSRFKTLQQNQGVQLGKQPGTILQVETEKKSAASPRLFSLSSLQSKMNQLMKVSAKDTLEAMQGLYEGKYLSYPRTDTPYITEGEYAYLLDHLDEYKHFLKAEAIPTPIHTPNSRYVNNKKVQEHYAIIPTKTVMTAAAFEQLSPLQQAIYEQVLKTTVAMFAEKYTYEETTILTQVQQLQLKAIGKVPVDLGWKKLFGKESDGKEKEEEPLLTSAEMTAKWESYLLKIGERKGTQTTFLANIQKFVSHLLEVVPGQIQSTDFGSTLQEVKAASEKQEAARHLGICPKCQEQEVLLYQKVAACTSEVCDFKLWTTIAKKKLTATQLKEIIQNSRTSQPVKGLKGQKGSFEATIVLKEDFTTGFEFSEKKKTSFKKRTRRTTK